MGSAPCAALAAEHLGADGAAESADWVERHGLEPPVVKNGTSFHNCSAGFKRVVDAHGLGSVVAVDAHGDAGVLEGGGQRAAGV